MTAKITIATRFPDLRIWDRVYKPADRVDLDEHVRLGHLKEGQAAHLISIRDVGYLTRETYINMMARRPAGEIPAGFTRAELIELKILDADAPTPAEAKRLDAASKPKPEVQYIPDGDPIQRAGFQIRPVKQGKFRLYEAVNQAGELLREKRFKKLEMAEAFIDGLVDAADSAKPASPEKEAADDRDVQREPDE